MRTVEQLEHRTLGLWIFFRSEKGTTLGYALIWDKCFSTVEASRTNLLGNLLSIHPLSDTPANMEAHQHRCFGGRTFSNGVSKTNRITRMIYFYIYKFIFHD